MLYICEDCDIRFTSILDLEEHVKNIHGDFPVKNKTKLSENYECNICRKIFKTHKILLRHTVEQHKEKRFHCTYCIYKTSRLYLLKKHEKTHFKKTEENDSQLQAEKSNSEEDDNTLYFSKEKKKSERGTYVRSAFRGKLQERVWKIRGHRDPHHVMNEYKERIKYACLLSLKKSPQKFYITMKVRFFKRDKDGHKIEESAFFHGSMYTLLRKEDFEDSFHSSVKKIMNAFDIFTRNGSGWILDRVENISLNSYHYEPVSASSYIPTPKAIKGKRAIINVQNVNDKKCFEYSVLAALYHHEIDKTNATKPSLYKKYLGEVLKGCKESMRIDDIPQFENRNNISIAVYRINKGNGKTVYPLYMTKRRDKDPINLLLIEGENYHHYTWIKHFNRLLKSPKQTKTKLFCPYCCYGFRKDKNGRSNLDEHKMFCQPNGAQRTKFLPKGKNYIEFKDFEKMQEAPYVIYADFECINEKVKESKLDEMENENYDDRNSSTEFKTNHKVSGFTFHTVSPYFSPRTVTYRNPDAGKVFIEQIHEEKNRILKEWEDNGSKTMQISSKEEFQFKRSTHCFICKKKFVENPTKSEIKVRDHNHFTGKFRGAAHSSCNISMRTVKKIPVFFHNLGGYDSHIIFNNLNKVSVNEPSIIAKAIERFVSFNIGKLHFKDSLQFLNSSLDKLTSNLAAKAVNGIGLEDVFPNLHNRFKEKWNHLPFRAFKMLTRKGVYPYTYMDNFEKFSETSLPSREKFYNDLSKEHISDDDYNFIHELWKTFQLKNLGELHDLYMETDVLLLADSFEQFREFSLLKYRLDPAHYNTAPSLSWSAALLYTKQRLEIPRDPNMHLFFDKGMRGGASQVATPWAQANHEGIEEKFNKEFKRAYIVMFDCNNQYGWAMSEFLPTGGFKWFKMKSESLQYWRNFILQQNDCQENGFFFEVDLEYPEHLHDNHDQYPLAPEHLEIKEEMLSEFQRKLAANLNVKVGGEKLCLTLLNKKNYICHYRNLKFYLEKGMKLKKVHRVLQFNQSPWIRDYIQLNTRLRQEAKNKCEQNFAKLMNNSFFGKTCEDVRKYKVR